MKIELVLWDQDGVLTREKNFYTIVRSKLLQKLIPSTEFERGKDTFTLYEENAINYEELAGFSEGVMFLSLLKERHIKETARKVPLQPHARHVVNEIDKMGIKQAICSLAPKISADIIAKRISPSAFLDSSSTILESRKYRGGLRVYRRTGLRVYAPYALFNADGIYAGHHVHFSDENGMLDKLKIVREISRKEKIDPKEILYVDDGFSKWLFEHCSGVAYGFKDERAVLSTNDLRDILTLFK
jgi:hypothetical protein